jgi:hypothetical protein
MRSGLLRFVWFALLLTPGRAAGRSAFFSSSSSSSSAFEKRITRASKMAQVGSLPRASAALSVGIEASSNFSSRLSCKLKELNPAPGSTVTYDDGTTLRREELTGVLPDVLLGFEAPFFTLNVPMKRPWALDLSTASGPGGTVRDGPAEAALARLVSRAPIIASFVDLSVPIFDGLLQGRIVAELHQASLLQIRGDLSVRENARLLSQSDIGACWCTTTPTHPSLVMSNKNFSTSIEDRLCINFHPRFGVSRTRPLLCQCGVVFDSFHALTCRMDGNPERTIIHDVIKLGVAAMMSGAGIRNVRIEPSASDTNNKRAVLQAVVNGVTVWLDVVTVSTAKVSDGALASYIPGAAALGAERAKIAAYGPLIAAFGSAVSFIPLAFELDGRWGDMAMDFFKTLSRLRGDSASEHAAWLISWHKILASKIRNAVASALDSRLKKAIAAAPTTINSSNPLDDAFAHILSSPPLGTANPTFEREGDLQQ